MKNLVIIGAGGLAREIFDLANYCHSLDPDFRIKGFLSDGPSDIESMGYPPVLGTVSGYIITKDDVFICGIGNVHDRKKCVEIILSKGGQFINIIHPNIVLSPSAKIGVGVAIKAFCVLASNVVVGDFTFLQSSCILGHDVQIARYCQINSFSFLAGCVKVNDLVTINAGAKIVQNIQIGQGSTIGMGSVVIKNVEEETTVFGIPAKAIDHT